MGGSSRGSELCMSWTGLTPGYVEYAQMSARLSIMKIVFQALSVGLECPSAELSLEFGGLTAGECCPFIHLMRPAWPGLLLLGAMSTHTR